MYLDKRTICCILLGSLFCIQGCSLRKGYLSRPSDTTAIGIVKFKVFDGNEDDISESCTVGYGENGISPNIKISNQPHFIELENKFQVKNINCLISLRLYSFDFDSFEYKINTTDAYNFGEYIFKFDYKKDYEDTQFFKKTQKDYRAGKLESYPDHNINVGQMTLLEMNKVKESNLDEAFPKHGKKQLLIQGVTPKNAIVKMKKGYEMIN